jgi:hypothetical protein
MAGYKDYAFALIHHAMGRTQEADAAIERLRGHGDDWAFQLASIHAFRGEVDESFRWLDRGAVMHDAGLIFVRHRPEFRSLHADPRWTAFLNQIGLTQSTTQT